MQAFIINLETAADRWAAIAARFGRTRIPVNRVPAVDGKSLQLPIPEFDESNFRLRHGRATNPREIGCYLSHVAAMHAFLETDDAHGLICEDDIVPGPEFDGAIESALIHVEATSADKNAPSPNNIPPPPNNNSPSPNNNSPPPNNNSPPPNNNSPSPNNNSPSPNNNSPPPNNNSPPPNNIPPSPNNNPPSPNNNPPSPNNNPPSPNNIPLSPNNNPPSANKNPPRATQHLREELLVR